MVQMEGTRWSSHGEQERDRRRQREPTKAVKVIAELYQRPIALVIEPHPRKHSPRPRNEEVDNNPRDKTGPVEWVPDVDVNVRVCLERRQGRIRRHDSRPDDALLHRQRLPRVGATSVVRHPAAGELVELVNRLLDLGQERRVQPLAADLEPGRRARDCRGLEAAAAREPAAESALVVPRLAVAEAAKVGLGLHAGDHAVIRYHTILRNHAVLRDHAVVRGHAVAGTAHVRSGHAAGERATELGAELSGLGPERRRQTCGHGVLRLRDVLRLGHMLRLGSRPIVAPSASATLEVGSGPDGLRHVDRRAREAERRLKALLGRGQEWTASWALERGL